MLKRTICCVAACFIAVGAHTRLALAQDVSPEEAAIDAMRTLDSISSSDQRRIGEWVQSQVDGLAATARQNDEARWNASKSFRAAFKAQFEDPENRQAFLIQFPTQTALIAAREFGRANPDRLLAISFGRVLIDMRRIETLPGLIAGLQCRVDAARLLCARGLADLKTNIGADSEKFNETVAALRGAALVESSHIVLGHMFRALAHTGANRIPTVFGVYLAVFDKRLEARRGGAVAVDGAELEAYEFLRAPGVLEALNNDQKVQLAGRLAVYLRLDAERYNTPDLKFYEIDNIERLLDSAEAIFSSPAFLGPNAGGKIRDVLDRAGFEGRSEVPPQAYLWVGDPQANTPGALNAAPWNVPIGAP